MDAPTAIFYSCFAFSWIVFIWELYLSIRQYRKYRDTVERPDELRDIIDEETFYKSRQYKLDKARFGFAFDIWHQLQDTAVLLLGLIPAFWHISGGFISNWNYSHETLQSLVFLVIVSFISKIVNLPWKVYSTFVIEEKHGFNKQTLGFFVKDEIKGFAVGIVIGLPITAGVIWIIQWGGDYFFVAVWLFLSIITFFLMTIYPEFIAPLFDKYDPLPDGELRIKIEALASKLEFPLKKLFVVEGSKRSAHSNAYLFGLWNNKRIVLYDTLLANYTPLNGDGDKGKSENDKDNNDDGAKEKEKPAAASEQKESAKKKKLGMSDDEVVAVIGHELGHWKLNHNLWNIFISEVNMFLLLAVFAFLYRQKHLYEAFGFPNSQPTLIGLLIIFEFVFAPYNEVLSFLMTMRSRTAEFQADAFSAKLGYSGLLQAALIKLEKDNLAFPVDDWLYSTWHHSHPPVPERVAAIKKFE